MSEILFEDPNRIAAQPGGPAGETGTAVQGVAVQNGSMLGAGLWLAFALLVTAASVGLWTFIVTGLWRLGVHLVALVLGG